MMERMNKKLEKLSTLEASYKYPKSYILMHMLSSSDTGIVMQVSDKIEDLESVIRNNGNNVIITGANL